MCGNCQNCPDCRTFSVHNLGGVFDPVNPLESEPTPQVAQPCERAPNVFDDVANAAFAYQILSFIARL